VLKRTLPNWNDEQAVAELAEAIIARREASSAAFEAFGAKAMAATIFGRESTAVEAALQGDVGPLAALLLDAEFDWLQPETRNVGTEISARRTWSSCHYRARPT
jgi:hypothetical protein